jgi:hypothetical protein
MFIPRKVHTWKNVASVKKLKREGRIETHFEKIIRPQSTIVEHLEFFPSHGRKMLC